MMFEKKCEARISNVGTDVKNQKKKTKNVKNLHSLSHVIKMRHIPLLLPTNVARSTQQQQKTSITQQIFLYYIF